MIFWPRMKHRLNTDQAREKELFVSFISRSFSRFCVPCPNPCFICVSSVARSLQKTNRWNSTFVRPKLMSKPT